MNECVFTLSEHVIVHAQEEALRSDVMMVAGSSLEVMPAADLPALAARRGAMLILVNLEPTKYDRIADVTVRGDVADVLPKLGCVDVSCYVILNDRRE